MTATISSFDSPVFSLAKIRGGDVVTPGEFPHNVGLYSPHSDVVRCGGAILSTYLILTAAHCLKGKNPRDFRIIAGEHNRKNRVGSEQARLAKEFYMHENYTESASGLKNDIALIVLSSPLVFTKDVKNISLPRQDEEFTGTAEIMGFGHTDEPAGLFSTTGDISDLLLKVQVPIISHDECAANYTQIDKYVTRDMFCAGQPGKDSCKGDSGGSTLCQRAGETEPVLCGVVSWGKGCGSEGFPGVNTKVSRYITWIQNSLKVLADRRKCQTHQFFCDGDCVSRDKICNGVVDCLGSSDEMGCHNYNVTKCDNDAVRCNNGKCVKRKFFCDGDNDCEDGTDELKCPNPEWTCKEDEIKCGYAGRCILKEWKCDGRFDCDDLSDENESCPNYNATAYQTQAATTTMKPPELAPLTPTECPSHEFFCPHPLLDDNCAPLRWRCDGDRDCLGGVDEVNCTQGSSGTRDSRDCPADKFYCPNPLLNDNCAPLRWRCDGDRDCQGGADEVNCSSITTTRTESSSQNGSSSQCPENKFYCPGSRFTDRCAPLRWKCDDESDCTGGVDEEDCPPMEDRCPEGRFYCPGNPLLVTNCARLRWRCDGDRDCRGGADEQNCSVSHTTTRATSTPAPTTTTTTTTSTTMAPAVSPCESHEFYCPNNRIYRTCVPLHFRCDGDIDCTGGLDEQDCDNELERDKVSTTTRPKPVSMSSAATTSTLRPDALLCAIDKFKCADGSRCLPMSFKCDGDRDCKDFSDESSCPTKSTDSGSARLVTVTDQPCPSDKFECPMIGPIRACIPVNWKCDGDSDCPGGHDEQNCGSATTGTTSPPTTEMPKTNPSEAQYVPTVEKGPTKHKHGGLIGFMFDRSKK